MLNNIKTRASLARMSNRARRVAVAVLAGVLLCAGAQARGDAVVTDLVVVGSDAQTLIFHRAFQRTAFSYSTAVPFAVSSVRVTATAEGAGASMRIGAVTLTSGAISAAINLDVGANALALIVTAGDASATYTLNIAREAGPPAPSSNADLADLRLTFGAFNEAFAPATQTYTATVPHLTAHLIAVLADPDAAFVNVHAEIGTLKSGERSTEPLAAPNPGDKRVIGFTVRAVDGTEKVYVITLMDEENTSATVNRIDILSCTTAAVGCAGRNFLGTNPVYAPPFSPDDPDMLDYTVTLPHDTPTNIAFDVRLTDGSTEGTLALVTTTGTAAVADNEITDDAESLPIPLGDATPPDNTVNLIITAKAGNTLTYALTMLFAPGPKTALTITPVAAAKTKTYGQPDPALAYDVTGLTDDTADEVFSATPFARATGEDAGEYAFSLKNPLPFRASFAAKYSVSLAASQVFLIAKKPLVHTDAAADKTYDGNNHPPASFAVPLTAAVRATIGSVMIDDSTPHRLRVRGCAFADKHAGDDKPITGCALAGGARDNYALSVTAAGDIGKLATRLTGIATAREYDGSADIGLPLASATFVPPIVRGDMVRVSGGAFADANPETGKTAAAAGITYAGADIGNYLITPVISGDITPKTVMVAEVVLQKEYDGARTLGASVIQAGSGEITGEVGDDAVTIAVGAAPGDIYAAAAAGAQTVTGVMFTLEASGGANAQNYQLPSVVAVSGLITKKAVTVTATDARRQYDGTTGAPSAARGAFASGNILSDDAPDVSIVFGTYNHKDAGQATTLSLELSGDKAGNYMPNPT
ncbi:MAG: YDG domain-containing protein, partial [Gammaproteobacteria bacterium]